MHQPPLLWSIFAAVIVLLAPGGALLAWLALDSPHPGASLAALRPGRALSALADAAALSISLAALLAMLAFLAGVTLPGWTAALLFALAALLLALGARQVYRRWPAADRRLELTRALVSLLLALLFVALLSAWRLFQARALALPVWVDSVHHTLVVRLIMERGGLPADLSPYLPVAFFYHYGFHLAAALFAGLAGVTADQAVLWFGQVLNAAVALSVYRAGEALLSPARTSQTTVESQGMEALAPEGPVAAAPRPAGVGAENALARLAPFAAALLVSFVFQMPAYYLTWGRYTLLVGMLLIGPTLAAAVEVWADPRLRAPWVRLALLIAGLALTHLFALLLVGLFLALMGLAGLARALRAERERPLRWDFLLGLAIFSVMGLLLAAPWTWRVWQYNQQLARVQFVNPVEEGGLLRQSVMTYLRYLAFLIGPRRSHILMAFAGLGLLAALRHPRRRFLAAWALLLALLALPWGLRMNPFRPDYFAIVLFFPAALLLAGLLADGAAALGQAARPWAGRAALALALALLVFWGLRETRGVTNPVTVLATAADVRALDWIAANLPADARFYTNAARWSGNTYRGVDGGYWLLPYTGRAGIVPPVFYDWGAPEYVATVTRQAEAATKIKDCSADFWSLVEEAGLTHVYLREGVGSLQPAALSACANVRPIYQQEGVHLFEIVR